jgi:hypothetical protein
MQSAQMHAADCQLHERGDNLISRGNYPTPCCCSAHLLYSWDVLAVHRAVCCLDWLYALCACQCKSATLHEVCTSCVDQLRWSCLHVYVSCYVVYYAVVVPVLLCVSCPTSVVCRVWPPAQAHKEQGCGRGELRPLPSSVPLSMGLTALSSSVVLQVLVA